MNILFLGDIMGEPGRNAIWENLPILRQKEKADFVIANGENGAKNGRGLTGRDALELREAGVDVITMGNHVWGSPDAAQYADRLPVVRPANIGKNLPGKGWLVTEGPGGVKIGVANIEGRVFLDLVGDNPFECADEVTETMRQAGAEILIVDFHAEATSEKKLMGLYLDGRVNAVLGTHTHVQTADETILPKGTAFITDVGMTGIGRESVIGMKYGGVSEKIIRGLPARFEVETAGTAEICGVVLEIDGNTKKTLSIRRVRIM